MDKKQRRQFHAALLSAFHTKPALVRMVSFGLDMRLDDIVKDGSLGDMIFDLIEWARAAGQLQDLVDAALESSPNNSDLQVFATEWGSQGNKSVDARSVSKAHIESSLNPKDRRVAIRFQSTLGPFMGTLRMFLTEAALENEMAVFAQSHEDKPSTSFPDPVLVDPFVKAFRERSLSTPSNIRLGERTLTWAEAFAALLGEITIECDQILNQYAERDDALISLVEDLRNRAKAIGFGIRISLTAPEFSGFYDNGVPAVHIDLFRYLFLTILKILRVTRQFGAD